MARTLDSAHRQAALRASIDAREALQDANMLLRPPGGAHTLTADEWGEVAAFAVRASALVVQLHALAREGAKAAVWRDFDAAPAVDSAPTPIDSDSGGA